VPPAAVPPPSAVPPAATPAVSAAAPPAGTAGAPVRFRDRLRAAAVPLGVLGSAAAGFAYVAAVDPNEPGHYPACPMLYYTGLYCPGCGGLRGAHALAHGQLRTAIGCNAVAVAGYAVLAVVWTVWFTRTLRGRRFAPALPPAALYALGGLLLAFTVVRNLPFGAALAP
jgi:hypothetical protein